MDVVSFCVNMANVDTDLDDSLERELEEQAGKEKLLFMPAHDGQRYAPWLPLDIILVGSSDIRGHPVPVTDPDAPTTLQRPNETVCTFSLDIPCDSEGNKLSGCSVATALLAATAALFLQYATCVANSGSYGKLGASCLRLLQQTEGMNKLFRSIGTPREIVGGEGQQVYHVQPRDLFVHVAGDPWKHAVKLLSLVRNSLEYSELPLDYEVLSGILRGKHSSLSGSIGTLLKTQRSHSRLQGYKDPSSGGTWTDKHQPEQTDTNEASYRDLGAEYLRNNVKLATGIWPGDGHFLSPDAVSQYAQTESSASENKQKNQNSQLIGDHPIRGSFMTKKEDTMHKCCIGLSKGDELTTETLSDDGQSSYQNAKPPSYHYEMSGATHRRTDKHHCSDGASGRHPDADSGITGRIVDHQLARLESLDSENQKQNRQQLWNGGGVEDEEREVSNALKLARDRWRKRIGR